LIFRLGSLGDTIVALPCFHLIARTFPNADRRLLTNIPIHAKAPAAAAVLGDSGLVHDYMRYAVGTRNLFELARLAWNIRRFRPDLLIYLPEMRPHKDVLRDQLFFRWACGIKSIVGLPDKNDVEDCFNPSTGRFQKRFDPATGLYEPEASRLARYHASLGDARVEDLANWDLRLNSAEKESAVRALSPLKAMPLIVCAPGSKMQSKDWGQENWRALLRALYAKYPGYGLVMAGARQDEDVCDYAARDWHGPKKNLAGKLTPRESAAVFASASLFVGPDSGPMHLAACFDIPCVCVFSARALPGVWFPRGQRNVIIFHQVPCSNCQLETCIDKARQCIQSVTVDEMERAVDSVLNPATLTVPAATSAHPPLPQFHIQSNSLAHSGLKPELAVKNVLIYRLGSLGDTVFSLPCFHLIQHVFPRARRILLTNDPVNAKAPAAAAVLDGSGLVDGYMSYTTGSRNPLHLLSLMSKIRRLRPDLLIYLTVSRGEKAVKRDAAFFRACGVKRIVGLPFGDLAVKKFFANTGLWEREASRLLRCLHPLGDVDVNDLRNWDLHLTQAETTKANQLLAPFAGRPIIACGPGTKQQSKDWGQEKWRELLARLSARFPHHALALIGAKGEADIADFAATDWLGPRLNLCGALTPRESAAVIRQACLFLGPDSGPMHLAAAYGVPCAIPFASIDHPGCAFPIGSFHRPIYHNVPCSFCMLPVCIEKKKICINSISVDEMFNAALDAMRLKELAAP